MKICHHQGAELSISNRDIGFISGEFNNYLKIGNVYLEFNLTVRKTKNFNLDGDGNIDQLIRLVNFASAYAVGIAIVITTAYEETEVNEHVCHT